MQEMRNITQFEHAAAIKREVKAALTRLMSYAEHR
jgi:hypothetical protein